MSLFDSQSQFICVIAQLAHPLIFCVFYYSSSVKPIFDPSLLKKSSLRPIASQIFFASFLIAAAIGAFGERSRDAGAWKSSSHRLGRLITRSARRSIHWCSSLGA